MKCTNVQLFSVIFLLLSFNTKMYSQESKFYLNGCLWLKNSEKGNGITELIRESEFNNNFNFNPIIDFSKKEIAQKYKNIVTKEGSLFVVFKSNSKEENVLFSLNKGTLKTTITNKKLVCDKEVLLNKGDSKNGILISYVYNKNSLIGRKNGNLVLDDLLFDNKKAMNHLVELIYIPRCISIKEKEIIESYLSLKYGISLCEGKNYYNSKGEIIWDIKENDGFNERITGIGKDTLFGLNQKQSKNSLEDGLTIGFDKIKKTNKGNSIILDNKDFLLWGDNGKSFVLEKSTETTQKRMKRVWKIKTVSDSAKIFKTQIKIDKSLMPVESNFNIEDINCIWLAIDNSYSSEFNYKNAQYFRATINDEKEIVFDNVEFLSKSDYFFTIVKSKENPNNPYSNSLTKSSESEISISDQIILFPNPITANEKFTIQFNLNDISKVIIQIADVNGKIIKTKDLGLIDNFSFTENLSASGTYLVMLSVNGKLETKKIIVK